MTSCAIHDCDRPHYARGWCALHYLRWYRHGDPGALLVSHETVHGTENGYSNRGCRCSECREAHRIAFAMRVRKRELELGSCRVRGCETGQYAKGYCKAHYERQRTGRPMPPRLHRRPEAGCC